MEEWYMRLARLLLAWPFMTFAIVAVLKRDIGTLIRRLSERVQEVKTQAGTATFGPGQQLEQQRASSQKLKELIEELRRVVDTSAQ